MKQLLGFFLIVLALYSCGKDKEKDPVVENDKLIGLISIGDLVKAVMEDQRKLIDQLQQYIAS